MKPLDPSQFHASEAFPASLATRFLPAIGRMRGVLLRHRRTMLAFASIVFVAGFAWALASANIVFSTIGWNWLLGAMALGFVGVALNGLELSLCARAIGRRFPAGEAINVSSLGILSNLLPVPASALVRGAALVARGATLAQSGRILLHVGLLRLAVAGAMTGAALLAGPIGMPIMLASLLASTVLVAMLVRSGGLACAAGLLALRIGMLGIVAVQLLLCFQALGAEAVLADAALHAIAPVVGSAVGIVPGGLGVSEAIGAALAMMASASPAMAFAALALNRIAGYACALATVLAFQLREAMRR